MNYCTSKGPCDEERCYCDHPDYNTPEVLEEELRRIDIINKSSLVCRHNDLEGING